MDKLIIDNPTTRELWILVHALRERTDEAVAAHKEAVGLASTAQKAHDIAANNLQAQMKDQGATFATKEHVDLEMRRILERLLLLEAWRNKGEGMASLGKAIWAVLGMLIALAATGAFKLFRTSIGTP